MELQRSAVGSARSVRHTPVILLSAVYLYAVGHAAAHRPLWYDEVFTRTIAGLEGPVAIVRALLDKADNHPPLDYLARHFSMMVFGGSDLAFRLPSIVAVLVASLALYAFVLRRCSVPAALVAFSLPFCTIVLRFAAEGRGYGFLFASACLALLAWQLAIEKQSKPRLAFLILSLCIGPYSHYYAVLTYAPIVVGEACRIWVRREISWAIVIAVILSLALSVFVVPFAVNASEYAAGFWTRFGPTTPFSFYAGLMPKAFPPIIASMIACIVLAFLKPGRDLERSENPGFQPHEIAAALTFCTVPFLTYLLAEFVTNALWLKYTLTTVVGIVLLGALVTHQVETWRRSGAIAIALCFSVWTAVVLVNEATQADHSRSPVSEEIITLIDSTDAPIVITDADQFLIAQTNLSEPRRRRVFYPSDKRAAMKYAGTDTTERALSHLSRYAPINVVDLCDFTRKHPRVLLVGKADHWIFRKFLDGKAAPTMISVMPDNASVYSVDLGAWQGCP